VTKASVSMRLAKNHEPGAEKFTIHIPFDIITDKDVVFSYVYVIGFSYV